MNPRQDNLTISPMIYGTVIDHIPHENTFKVVEVLNLNVSSDRIFIGINVNSKVMSNGKKGLIKIEGRELSLSERKKLVLLAPEGTFNLIKDSKVIEKKPITLPDEVLGVIKNCPNPKCISNKEIEAKTIFKVVKSRKNWMMECYYCEKIFDKEKMLQYI